MSDEMDLLRESRADVPAPNEQTRHRAYVYATHAAGPRLWLADWLAHLRRVSLLARRCSARVPCVGVSLLH